ncbi:MAG: 50S ribosomal protein L23 [Candidatus Buchananbacteria bacterium]
MSILNNIFNKEEETKAKPAKKVVTKTTGAVKVKPVATEKSVEVADIKKSSHGNLVNQHLLVRPVITEKSANLAVQNKYVFAVLAKANKTEVAKVVAAIYGVTPIKVNMIKVRGRKVKYGKTSGETKAWKKALITLKAGEKIEFSHQNA